MLDVLKTLVFIKIWQILVYTSV